MTSPATATGRYSVVIPSLGRPSLQDLLDSLTGQEFTPDAPAPTDVVVVDDRPGTTVPPLDLHVRADWPVRVIRGFGRGPAAARNTGWQLTGTEWVVFLDDDVQLPPGWAAQLSRDLTDCEPDVAGSQARLRVPLPSGRRPTDWERGTAGLQDAAWATADMAYRRKALLDVGGFDERFPRAYREDADLAIRVQRAGWRLVRGERLTVHPVRPADDWVSLRVQRGNADDVLMRRLHGRNWRTDGQVPRGRWPWHLTTTGAAVLAGAAALAGRRRMAAASLLAWAGLSADFAVRRIAPGPQRGRPERAGEVRRMVLTSLAIPPAAVAHRLGAEWRYRRPVPGWPLPVRAVLFDRDGTLVHDVPYNGDPALVKPVDDAAAAVGTVRAAGLGTAVVTNQSGIARGLLTRAQVDAVNAEVDRRLGPFNSWQVCPHGELDGCDCRKPAPGMVRAAAAALGVRADECVVIGDIGADIEAARAAGARAVLVPTATTRAEEIRDAPLVAGSLLAAVEAVLAISDPARPSGPGAIR